MMMMVMMMSYSKYINEECHTNLEVLGDIDFIFVIFKKNVIDSLLENTE